MPRLFGTLALDQVIGTIFYCILGVILFILAYAIISKLSPFSVEREISEDQNIALGIIIGAVIIGLSIIIAAAIH